MLLRQVDFYPDLIVPSDLYYGHHHFTIGTSNLVDEFDNEIVTPVHNSTQCNRFEKAVLCLYDCTENDISIAPNLKTVKELMYYFCNDNEVVMHVAHSKIRDVLIEKSKIVTICQFEYLNTKMECQRVAATYLEKFFRWFFSESKAPVYVPVLISGWELDKLICHIFFDDRKEVIHIPVCDLRYFGTLWTFTLADDL